MNFCLAGGVAMNCKMNGEIYKENYVNKVIPKYSLTEGLTKNTKKHEKHKKHVF